MNHADDVVTQHLQQGFVALSNRGLAADGVAELPLNRGERRFDVRPSVVARKEFVSVELEEVKHAVPQGRLAGGDFVRPEWNERLHSHRLDQLAVEQTT